MIERTSLVILLALASASVAQAQGLGAIEVIEGRGRVAAREEAEDAPASPSAPTSATSARPQASAQDEPRWRGAWLIEGQVAYRYVWGTDAAPALEARVDELGELAVEGRSTSAGFTLTGVCRGGESWTARDVRVEGRLDGPDALEVRFEVRDEPSAPWRAARRERWCRPGPAQVEIVAARGLDDGLAYDPAAPLELIVAVRGRPSALVIQVLTPGGDARYEHLDGLVHHEVVLDGEVLPVGEHRLRWSGHDRSWRDLPVLPGRYLLVVAAHDAGAGPAPADRRDDPARHEVHITVKPAAALAAAPQRVSAARAP